AQRHKHLGDSAHADSADAYQVNPLEISKRHHHGYPRVPKSADPARIVESAPVTGVLRATLRATVARGATSSIKLTMSRAALGVARLRAAVIIFSISRGWSRREKISLQSRSALSSGSGIT